LCLLTGFEEPNIVDFNLKWKFETRDEIGDFLYKLHAMTKTTPKECLRGAEEMLGIEKKDSKYYLNWPMKFILTKKTE
jgi:predicted solute-binding protein